MSETLTFSQCLIKLMQKHALSSADLAVFCGGRAELKKILSESSTRSKRTRFFQNLCKSGLFSQEECLQMECALEASHLGVENYKFQLGIRRILSGCPSPVFDPLRIEGGETLKDRLEILKQADKVEIICINCCFSSLISALSPLFESPERDIQLWHLLHANAFSNAAASFVGLTFPLLFDSRYLPYGIDIPVGGDVHSIGGNLLSIRAYFGTNELQFFFVITDRSNAVEMINASEAKPFTFLSKTLRSLSPQPFPFKESPAPNEDYTQLCMSYLSHELNRATYSITNDLLFHQTPTDIAVASLREKGIFSHETVEALIQRTAAIHEQRYQNQYSKKKDTYRIMTYAGCKRFLQTGLCTDHFFGFRAFTPEERKKIFGETIEYAQKNPHFIPLLIKDHSFECKYNMIGYDKLGVSLDMADTDYNIEKGHHSVFLMFPEFTRQYMDFYLSTLVKEKCHSPQESLELLINLYEQFVLENP